MTRIVDELEGPALERIAELDAAGPTPAPLELSREQFAHRLRSILALKSVDLPHCAAAPVLRFRPQDLPDHWSPDLHGVWLLLRRLTGYAGLEEFPIDLEDGRTGYSDFADAISGELSYLGFRNGQLCFGVGHIGAPDAMIGPAALAVAWAWLHVQRTHSGQTGQGYRASTQAEAAPMPDESDAAIAALALGFGLILANASYDPKSVGKDEGLLNVSKWVCSSVGLPVDVTTWGFALWLALTATPEAEAVEYRRTLNSDQQRLFDDALAEMQTEIGTWREQVGWPHKLGRLPRRNFEQPAIDAGPVTQQLALLEDRFAAEQRYPNRGQPVGRVLWYSGLFPTAGFFAGIGVCIAMAAPLPGLLLPFVGIGVGRLFPKYRCADIMCEGLMRLTDKTCRRCGGTIVVDLKRARDRLSAIEDWEQAGGRLPAPAGEVGRGDVRTADPDT